MPSTYTLNNGIELIGTGEQSGTWGDTTNTNFELLDSALDGQVTVTLASAGMSGSPNALAISDGAASDGRNRMVIFDDGGDLGATAYVQLTPNDAEKIIYIRNDLSGSRSILLFQGTYNASNDYEVPAGTTAVVYFDGAGSGAVAANVFNNAYFDSLRLGSVSVTEILDEDDMASDSATALATQQSIKKYVDDTAAAQNELSEVLANGNTSGGNALQMTTTDELQFRDTDIKISSTTDGKMDIDADVEVEIVAPTVDIDAATAMTIDTAALTVTGAVDLNTSLNVDGDIVGDGLTIAGDVSVDGGDITLDGNLPGGTDNVALGNTAGDALTTGGINNTAIGSGALSAATTQDNNTALGYNALTLTEAASNTGLGASAGAKITTGPSNTAVGQDALNEAVSAGYNTAVGAGAGDVVGDELVATALVAGINYTIQSLGTTDFTLIGAGSNTVGTSFTATGAGTGTGTASANANYNTLVGHQSGNLIVGGSKNTVLGRFSGNQGGLDIRNSDNHIVLSDGDGNPRLYVDDSGDATFSGAVTTPDLTATTADINGGTIDNTVIGGSTPAAGSFTTGSFTGDVSFGDNDKAIFGAGSDLQIYHDGADSYISEGGTGGLYLGGSANVRITNPAATETMAQFTVNGAATLYYDNSEKLATTSTGIDVTGTVTADGAETNSFDSSGTSLEIKSGARVRGVGGGEFQTSSGVTNDASEPTYTFRGDPDTGIFWGGANTVGITTGGSEAMRIDSSGQVGIGTTSPSETLDVATSTNGDPVRIRLTADDAGGTTRSGNVFFDPDTNTVGFRNGGSDALHVDSSANLLVGKTSADVQTNGFEALSTGRVNIRVDEGLALDVRADVGSTVDDIAVFRSGASGYIRLGRNGGAGYIDGIQSSDTGLKFEGAHIRPRDAGADADNVVDLGNSSWRFDDIYATNGTIQTSDRNEKQDIAELDEAEKRVAIAAKGLIRKYRWKDAVAEKGDDARIHVGIIAQDLQDAFAAEGLDAGRYAMFISTTWWEAEVEKTREVEQEDGTTVTETYTATETYDEPTEGAVERTRLGVRYPELLAFIIGAL